MNDKLLRAFIEAQGYEIEEVTEEFDESGSDGGRNWFRSGVRVIDYKVTKKKSQVRLDVDGTEWSGIVEFVLAHEDEIRSRAYSEEYGSLKPILDFFSRSCNNEKI